MDDRFPCLLRINVLEGGRYKSVVRELKRIVSLEQDHDSVGYPEVPRTKNYVYSQH